MEKIIVIGCPGSGKSTFSRALAERTGLPLYYLDMIYWNEDKTHISREELCARLAQIMENEKWILDGNYLSTMDLRMEKCDTVFFLDYPLESCLSGVQARIGKPRPDMPWIETEWDEEFIGFIKKFENESRPKIISLLEKHKEKEIHRFKSREEAEFYLKSI